MSVVMISTMVLCFALSVSVAVAIGLSAVAGMTVTNVNMLISVKEMFSSLNKFPLAAIEDAGLIRCGVFATRLLRAAGVGWPAIRRSTRWIA